MVIVTLVLEGLLGLVMAYAAYTLFAWTPLSLAKAREALHYPRWYWLLAGIVAAIGAIALLVGLGIPVVGAAAALWMVAYFVVATFTHLLRKDFAGVSMPLLFLAICGGLLVLRWADAAPLRALVGL
jgi:DoxX-like protein